MDRRCSCCPSSLSAITSTVPILDDYSEPSRYRVLYRETHVLLDDLAEAVADGTRKEFMESLATVPLLIIDDFGMRKLPLTAAEDLLEIIMNRIPALPNAVVPSRNFAI